MRDNMTHTQLTVLSCLFGVIVPRISGKILREMNEHMGDDCRLLGKVVADVEHSLTERVSRTTSDRGLDNLVRMLGEEVLESEIRTRYLTERLNRLKPAVDRMIGQLQAIGGTGVSLPSIGEKLNEEGQDIIDDIKARFHVEDMSPCDHLAL